MLTPQEIQSKKFEKAIFGGYEMSQIDDFLDTLITDFTTLHKENATLKAKMKVLATKVEEYRSIDDHIRKTFFDAQTKAKILISDAEIQADKIIKGAKKTAEDSISELQREYVDEQNKLSAIKGETVKYTDQIKELLRKNIEIIDAYILKAPESIVVVEDEEPIYPQKASVDTFEFTLPKDFIVDDSDDVGEENIEPSQPMSAPEHKVAKSKTQDGAMDTQYFDIKLSPPGAKKESKDDDTGKIYPEADGFTPKPKNKFDDLRFGENFTEDDNI